jgi:curved DNA-binding protein CbpA
MAFTAEDFEKLPDFYELLGVSPGMPEEEFKRTLKRNYRGLARQHHEDVREELPGAEVKRHEKEMRDANIAYHVLSDPERRVIYDRWSEEKARGWPEGRRSSAAVAFEKMFGAFFRDLAEGTVFGERVPHFGDWGLLGRPQREVYDYFLLPVNDWGLLAALIAAYQAEDDGKWEVRRAETDNRDWMPEVVFSVKREGGKVHVFRTIRDWRNRWDRDENIEIGQEDNPYVTEEELEPDTRLGEYYLYGHGGGRVRDCLMPHGYGEYLQALKSLAGKIARRERTRGGPDEGKYDVQGELQVINEYTRGSSKTRKDGSQVFLDLEVYHQVPFDGFWQELDKGEGRVTQVEGLKTPEGQPPVSGEEKG